MHTEEKKVLCVRNKKLHVITKQYKKMINFDHITEENIKEHNPNWPKAPDHPYRILVIGSSGSGKTNSFFNLISHIQDPYEVKYQFLINIRESIGLNHFHDPNNMNDIYKNIEEYNPGKKRKILLVFDMFRNKKLPIVT